MHKYLMLIGLTLLTSCTVDNRTAAEKNPFSKIELEYLASLDLESKVYMTRCLNNKGNIWMTTCIEQLKKLGKPTPAKGLSAGDIAAGVAIGNILTK